MPGREPEGPCKSVTSRARFVIAAASFVASLAQPAHADALNVVGGISVLRDSNVFKRKDATADTTQSYFAGLRLDLPYSQQRFELDVTRTAYRHTDLAFLDFDGTDYRGAWRWYLTSRLTGSLTAARTEQQVPYLDFQGTQKNIARTRREGFTLDGVVGYGVHVIGGASHVEQTSSVPFLAQTDFRLTQVEGGLKYLLAGGSSISLLRRRGEGQYVNRVFDPLVPLDTDFTEHETELQASLIIGGRSTLNGRLTRVERRHEHLSQLDSSGYGGEATYVWNATGKLSLGLAARRALVPYFDVATTHRVDKSLAITPRWQASDRIALSGALTRMRSDFQGDSRLPGTASREDTYDVLDLSLSWTPTRIAVLTASFQQQQRRSNDPAFEFDATIARLGATLIF